MNTIYEKISAILIKNHAINENDKELYEYAIKLTVHGIINIIVIVIVGIFFGMLKQSFSFQYVLFLIIIIAVFIFKSKWWKIIQDE